MKKDDKGDYLPREEVDIGNIRSVYRMEIMGGEHDGVAFCCLRLDQADDEVINIGFPLSQLKDVTEAMIAILERSQSENIEVEDIDEQDGETEEDTQ